VPGEVDTTITPSRIYVVATAGHVDHGKSSLIVKLTGIDPDRFAEEKRRGLTIDLGYAWRTLPSGREVGFVDVPGHERFIGNMLAGVGPVRLVLFVVAADEGWRRQSEEHLQILDVLGVTGGVVALTKRDLVDAATLHATEQDVRARLRGTALADAPIVAVSARSGEGIDTLEAALDAMLGSAPVPEVARPRLFVDRIFTIKGAGTVVTGTLSGDCLSVGDEVELYPTSRRARIRSLQTHKRMEERACPISRVAANLVGAEREELERGDVLGRAGDWLPTQTFEGVLRPVRDLGRSLTVRGAYKLYAGAAEADAKIRLLGADALDADGQAYVRIRLSRPLVLDVFDRFVLREMGRRETVAGGVVLDVAPPSRSGAAAPLRLSARASATRAQLPSLLAAERGAVRAQEAEQLTGASVLAEDSASGADHDGVGAWLLRPDVREAVQGQVREAVAAFHERSPLQEGFGLPQVRGVIGEALRRAGAPADPDLIETALDSLGGDGGFVRTAGTLRLASHRVELDAHGPDLERLLAAVGGEQEATPATVKDLLATGVARDVIEAAARAGLIVRVSPELVFTPALVARAEALVRASGPAGITVGAFREGLGTSRKYAVPLLEWFDQRGITRREGDLRIARAPG
jgi:selenocysteine-specific elongation factor